MEPATSNIDMAADFAADGKVKEAQACYREAIAALDRVERENPERADTPEFATVRNKRAYINAALDSMLLAEARDNAKAVAVTDTTALEVKLALKPWNEFLASYVVLTNADRLIARRMAFLDTPAAQKLFAAADDEMLAFVCTSNRQALVGLAPTLKIRRAEIDRAYRKASLAVERLNRFSKTVSTSEGLRFFDVSRDDVRAATKVCTEAWPKFAKSLDTAGRCLEAIRDALMANAEKLDQKELVAFDLAWSGGEVVVPTKEEDRGLVKDEGDKRPKVERQIDAYMARERKHGKAVTRTAEKVKARKQVQREVKKLLKEDPKSRRARLLQAGEDLRNGDAKAALEKVKALLEEKPNDAPALNMRAAIEAYAGDLKAAEKTLDQAIRSSPRDYHAYYNMANIFLQKGNRDGARRYYETGRSFSGPRNPALEKAVMGR